MKKAKYLIENALGRFIGIYDSQIKPNLASQNVEEVKHIISEECHRGYYVLRDFSRHLKPEIYTGYLWVLQSLNQISDNKKMPKNVIEGITLETSLEVNKIDIFMQNNPIYRNARNWTKHFFQT